MRRRRAGSAPRWAGARRGGCVPTRWSCARASRPTARRARPCSRSSTTSPPVVEGISIDEAFIDARGLRRIKGTPTEIAQRLRREVREQVGLPITVGVARTKFLAKVASGVAKPDGLLVVAPDRELAFLHPLPVDRLWGVGEKTATKLYALGITTVGDVARLSESTLVELVGRGGGPQAPRARAQPRPAAGARPAAALDGLAARARRPPSHARGARHDPRRDHRPAGAPAAHGEPRVPHRHAAAALRRLRDARDPLAHAALQDGAHARHPRGRPRPPRRRAAADPSSAGSRCWASRSRTSRTPSPSSCGFRSTPPRRSTPRSTRSATATGRRPSRAPCCWGATTGRPCPCSPTDDRA